MNIFYLDENPLKIARALVDKHVVKMPLESAQMLSTAHRLIDGTPTPVTFIGKNGKPKKKVIHLLDGETLDLSGPRPNTVGFKCYSVAHARHPSTIWTMANSTNYLWHAQLFEAMLLEYTARYGKQHKAGQILPFLKNAPTNIKRGAFADPTPAMPEKYKVGSSLESYRRYYAGEKWRFAKWKHGEMPEWLLRFVKLTWDEDLAGRDVILEKLSKKKTLPLDKRLFDFAQKVINDQVAVEDLLHAA